MATVTPESLAEAAETNMVGSDGGFSTPGTVYNEGSGLGCPNLSLLARDF